MLDALKPQVRAYFREARPQLSSDTLILSFPYGFHHKMASEHLHQIEDRRRRCTHRRLHLCHDLWEQGVVRLECTNVLPGMNF